MDRKPRARKEVAEFRFDPAEHKYWLGTRLLPGTTEVRRGCGIGWNYGMGSELASTRAMEIGSAVHSCTELYDKGTLIWASVKDELYPYVMAWLKFREDTGYRPNLKFRETPMYHPVYEYATKPDCGDGRFKDGSSALVEIKTGSAEKWHKLQTAAQELILPKKKNKKRMAVYLDENGGYWCDVHDDPMDGKVWLSLVVEYKWRQQNGYISK